MERKGVPQVSSLEFFSEILQFISDTIGHVVWPVLVGVILWIFRKPISAVISSLRRITYRRGEGLSADFDPSAFAELKELPEDTAQPVEDEEHQVDQNTIELSEANPRGLVIEAWIGVEQAMARAARERGLRPARSITRMKQNLLESGALDPGLNGLIEDLRVMRNEAAHRQDLELKPEEARHYALLASEVITALELRAGAPANLEHDAPFQVEPLSTTTITVTVTDAEGLLVGAVPISVVKVEGAGELDDVRGGYTSDGRGVFSYLAPLTPGEAVLLIRAGAAGQEINSSINIRVQALT